MVIIPLAIVSKTKTPRSKQNEGVKQLYNEI
jgi:hypothetical protein